MKKIVFLVCFLLAVSTSSALALSFAEVGGYDVFKDSTNQQLNENEEKSWIATAFGYNPADVFYDKINGNAGWTPTGDGDGSDLYIDFAQYTTDTVFAFIVKSGNATGSANGAFDFNDGNNSANDVSAILFENVASFRFGVIDLDWFTKNNGQFTIDAISHTSFGAGTTTVVPEPSTFILLGAGLAGLVCLARRRRKE